MDNTNLFSRVLGIGDPGPIQDQITSALGAQSEFNLINYLSNPERLAREVHAAEPDILLVDHTLNGQPTLDIIDDLALQFPESVIVTILPGEDPIRAQQVMLAGARAFMVQPFTQVNLLSTLRRVRDLELRRMQSRAITKTTAPETARPLKTMMIFSPRGGVGCSTAAINLALALHQETAKRVLLMEGKLFFGHLDVMLNIRSQNTIADLIPHANSLDPNLVQEVVVKHATGLHILLAPKSLQVAQGIRPDDLYNVFVTLQNLYDFIVIDGGSLLNENTVTLMDAADRILLVAAPDMASLHDTSLFIQLGRTLSYPSEKMLVLLNRSGILGGVKQKDIESALRHMVFAHIPDDAPTALRSLNRGVPLFLHYTRSPVAKAYKTLANTITDLSALEVGGVFEPKSSSAVQRDVLLASSRLG
jgi:pilus assembly protein CpaE